MLFRSSETDGNCCPSILDILDGNCSEPAPAALQDTAALALVASSAMDVIGKRFFFRLERDLEVELMYGLGVGVQTELAELSSSR